MTIIPQSNRREPFRVFVTSLGRPYTAGCTGFHPHARAAFDAAADIRIYPPFWIGCIIEAPKLRTNATKRSVREAFDRFLDRLTNNIYDRLPTMLRSPRLKITPPNLLVEIGGAKKELYYLFVEVDS